MFVFSKRTSLHYSSNGGHVDACRFLVASKADVNAKDGKYDTHSSLFFEQFSRNIGSFLNILISASGLHCTSLRIPVRSKSASFSSRQKQTSPPGTGTAASFACSVHTSLTSFKVWRHSPQNRHEQRPQRRHCVSAQLHGTAMIALAPSTAL